VLFGRDALSGVVPGPIKPTSVVVLSKDDDDDRDDRDRVRDNQHHDRDYGRDDHEDDNVTVELRTYTVLDLAGSSLVLTEKVRKTVHSLTGHIVSLEYGNGPVLTVPRNKQSFEWKTGKSGDLRELAQRFEVGTGKHEQEFSTQFDAEDNETEIREESKHGDTETPGLVLLQMATDNGKLVVQF